MTDFLIKSTIASVVFLVLYHLILENEKMHRFNRFYLLFSIVISLLIPFISFEIIKEVPVDLSNKMSFEQGSAIVQTVEETDYSSIFLWTLYGIVATILTVRFAINIWKILSKAKVNSRLNFKNSKLVLVEENILPHTFLNYIFVNSDDHQNRNIEEELYAHELVHVTQKHTFDILFIEFLKIIFWYNPIFWFYKKAIQLNHEFLADQEIVEKYNDVPFYQNLLLKSGNGNQTVYLASNLNYLLTKKRLIMMKKTTSKNIAVLKKIALIPVIGVLTTFLCVKTIAQETKTATNTTTNTSVSKSVSDVEKYYSKTTFIFRDKQTNAILKKKYVELTDAQKRMIPPPMSVPAKKSPDLNAYSIFKDNSKCAIWIDGVHVPNADLEKYNADDFVFYNSSFVNKNARSQKFPQRYQVHLYTENGFSKVYNEKGEFGPETMTMGNPSEFSKKTETVKKETNQKNTDAVVVLKNEPQFPDGIEAFYKFIGNNFKVPAEADKIKLEGKLIITFMIEKDGSLSEFTTVKDLGYGTADEAIRVLKLSPKWIPGLENGEPVRVLYTLPITIQSPK